MPVHEGHRSRKKEQFRAHGLDAFADHEVLELLLYYAVPRQDTNPIAHRLMQKFGSLEAVFSADRETLEEVEGVGENASTLLTLMLPLMRRTILFVCVANTSSNMLLFAPMQLVTEGGPRNSPNVLMYEAYRSAFRYADMPRCAVIVSVLLVIILAIALVQFFALGDRDTKRGVARV